MRSGISKTEKLEFAGRTSVYPADQVDDQQNEEDCPDYPKASASSPPGVPVIAPASTK
jgi:hypothetical protein